MVALGVGQTTGLPQGKWYLMECGKKKLCTATNIWTQFGCIPSSGSIEEYFFNFSTHQWFWRRTQCKKLTDDGPPSDGKSSLLAS
jgi:hypothetical protein